MRKPEKGRKQKPGRFFHKRNPYPPDYRNLQKSKGNYAEKRTSNTIRLNSYIAKSGICSRREADVLIREGKISVNGKIVTTLGTKVSSGDIIKYKGKIIKWEKLVYVLLNKPKDCITTTKDPDNRPTVMDIVSKACHERIFPVGRLDRNTTGLILFTNDGDLAEKLSHPSNKIRKLYQVEFSQPVDPEIIQKILEGVMLEDGIVKVDDIQYVSDDKKVIGLELHSGKNRIVRRIFEHFGYEILKLDRVMYAGLTKKDLPRGKWRYLKEKEVIQLKYMHRY